LYALTMTITAVTMQLKNKDKMKNSRFIQLFFSIFMTIILLISGGCASSSNTVIDEEIVTNQKPMALYNSLIIKDFELKRELYSSEQSSRVGEREQRYAKIPAQLADLVKRYLVSKNIYRSVERDGTSSAKTLVLKGKFTNMGRFKISIEAVLTDSITGQEVAFFRQTLWDVFDTTESIGSLGRGIADYIDRIQYK
jgi:hypothetical protein